MIDLHVHTTASDGSDTPAAVVEKALQLKLKAIAITDHDTIGGIAEAVEAAKGKNIAIIPGVELSTEREINGNNHDVHILGYNIDYKNFSFVKKIEEIANSRTERNEKMCAALRKFAGSDITIEKIKAKYGDGVLTRANFAMYITDEGITKNKDEAFEKYLNKGRKCYFPKKKISVEEAVGLIKSVGGKPVLAHPVLIKDLDNSELTLLVGELKSIGIEGLECYYSNNNPGDTETFIEIANKYGLFITGGSDYHGINKRIDLGIGYDGREGHIKLSVPDELLDNIL